MFCQYKIISSAATCKVLLNSKQKSWKEIIWWTSILETKTERDSQKKPGAYLINQKMFLFPDKGSVDLKVLVPIK